MKSLFVEKDLYWYAKAITIIAIIIAIIIHVWYTLRPPTFFHPDEVFQTYEISHFLVYGYGITSWEWEIGGWVTASNPDGYGPIRSLISPLIFSSMFILGEFLGLNYWNGILPLSRIILLANFLVGLFIVALFLKELDKKVPNFAGATFLILALFYYDFIIYGSKSVTNTLVIPLVFGGLYLYIREYKNANWYYYVRGIIGGFLVGLAIWIRPDSAIFMAIFVLLFISHLHIRKIFSFGFGFFISFLFNGFLDQIYYGQFFLTFPNFIRFNSENQAFYGSEPFGWYFSRFILQRLTLGTFFYISVILLILCSIYAISRINKRKQRKPDEFNNEFFVKYKLLVRLFLWVLLTLLWWEMQPHKEERFMIGWEISLFMLGAFSISWLTKELYLRLNPGIQTFFSTRNLKLAKKPILSHFFIILLIFLVITSPFVIGVVQETPKRSWNNFNDILEAFVWVGQQDDVKGVYLVMESIWYSGGHSYLHQDVPLKVTIQTGTNDTFEPKIFSDQYNYLVIPQHQYFNNPSLYNDTVASNFTLVQIILERTDVWLFSEG